MPIKSLSRRQLLKAGATLGAAELVGGLLSGCGGKMGSGGSGPGPGSTCAKITDIDHVVIVIQENRSFDHYFGSYRGVRGFADPSAAFQQPYPGNTPTRPRACCCPFTSTPRSSMPPARTTLPTTGSRMHQSWNNGAMDGFVTSRLSINPNDAVLTDGLLHARRPALLLRARRCLYPLRQLLLFGDRPH